MLRLSSTLIFLAKLVKERYDGFEWRKHQRSEPWALDHHRNMDSGGNHVSCLVHQGS